MFPSPWDSFSPSFFLKLQPVCPRLCCALLLFAQITVAPILWKQSPLVWSLWTTDSLQRSRGDSVDHNQGPQHPHPHFNFGTRPRHQGWGQSTKETGGVGCRREARSQLQPALWRDMWLPHPHPPLHPLAVILFSHFSWLVSDQLAQLWATLAEKSAGTHLL